MRYIGRVGRRQNGDHKVCAAVFVLGYVRCIHMGAAADPRGEHHSGGFR